MIPNDKVFEFAAELDKEVKAVIMAVLDKYNFKHDVTEYYVTPLITVDHYRRVASVTVQGEIKLEL